MAPDPAQFSRVGPAYLVFAAAYSNYARAVFVFLRRSPRILEEHRQGVIEQTKMTWALCKRFGIPEDDEREAA